VKICIVGGGSTYTPELVEGLLAERAGLGLRELHLVDSDQQRLDVLGPFARRMAARAALEADEAPVTVSWGLDRRAGIAGSSFVVSQIRVGGMAARERDEQLGREFGLIGQETVGVGGLANALRTIPVALAIADDVAQLAPGATLLNFTNPAGLVTEALCRHRGDVTSIGLCNVPWTFRARLARLLGVEAAQVGLDHVGLNHLSWVRGVTVDGVDRTADAFAAVIAAAERPPRPGDDPVWTAAAVEALGAIPNPYLRYYYDTARMLRLQSEQPTRASQVADIERALIEQYADPALDVKPAELMLRGGAYYSVAAARLVADLASGAERVHVVDVPNRGAIPGLPDDVVVEVAARTTAQGVETVPVAPLRADVDALLRTMKDVELMVVEAAVTGDESAAVRALVAHPLGPSLTQARAVWDRLVELNAGMLGRLG
jgi:6-phospho-beta-glucosidase